MSHKQSIKGSIVTRDQPILLYSVWAEPSQTWKAQRLGMLAAQLGQPVTVAVFRTHPFVDTAGMAAVSAVVMTLCGSGDHVIAADVIYGGTYSLLHAFLPRKAGITTTFVPVHDLEAVAAAFTPHTKMLITEVVANPTLAVADIPALAQLAHAHGAKLVVDNTFTPLIMTPARLGADIVLHSLTKFISGGADIIGGCVCGPRNLLDHMLNLHDGSMVMLGPTMDPKIAHDLYMRLPHLELRLREHGRRAAAMAQLLHSLGAKVAYTGLANHPNHKLMQEQANPGFGCGGMLTIDMGSKQKAAQLVEQLQNVHHFGLIAVSLGYFDTLMCLSAASTARDLPTGPISAGLIRVSVGITGSLEGQLQQLETAYKQVMNMLVHDDVAAAAAVASADIRLNHTADAIGDFHA